VRVERVVLEDHRDVAILGWEVVDDLVADPHRALGDLFQTGDHPERGRLAAPRGAYEDDQLRVLDHEVERGQSLRSIGVDLRQLVELDLGHAASERI
jgi:hypothetical protein